MEPTSVVLERIYPKLMDMDSAHDRDSLEIHLARYRFAAGNLQGGRVLDLACGAGFGTALMAERHPDKYFVGVDIDPLAVDYARSHYRAANLDYICSDAMTFQTAPFDSIVSLETIEHLPDPAGFVARTRQLLNPSGRVIASVPVTPTCDGNPHHLHDFSRGSFYRLFARRGFLAGEQFRQRQPWVYSDAFAKTAAQTSRSHGVGHNVLAYYRKKPWALLPRLYSLLVNGPCNIYLTTVFEQKSS